MGDYESDSGNLQAPMMQRTKHQLATAYAPGAIFTFEGNLVVCESHPLASYPSTNVDEYTKSTILNNIEERARSWLSVGEAIDTAYSAEMCLEKDFLNEVGTDFSNSLNSKLFGFVEPVSMAYEPTLLSLYCNHCKRVKPFKNIKELDKFQNDLGVNKCAEFSADGQCNWRQLDIIFVHPNGNWQEPTPLINRFDNEKGRPYVEGLFCRKGCGSAVKIDDQAAQIGKRYFYCAKAGCGLPRNDQWVQNEKEYTAKYMSDPRSQGADIRMKPISYRANSVHYVQQDMVIDFGKSKALKALDNPMTLKVYIAEKFGLKGKTLSDSEKRNLLIKAKGAEGEKEWENYSEQKEFYKNFPETIPETIKAAVKKDIEGTETAWEEDKVFPIEIELPEEMDQRLRNRQILFSSKYDPFKLLVEHEALREKVVNNRLLDNGLRSFTPMDDLDEYVGPEDESIRAELNKRHRSILDSIGIEKLGLIRRFQTIHYSFGYTRVGSSPTVSYINDRIVPVRLRLFGKTRINDKGPKVRPIFVLKQDNEAIYVKLNEETVRLWLESIELDIPLSSNAIGQQYLETVPELTPFLDSLPTNNTQQRPNMALATYTLLHTYAHHVMTSVSEFSGLGIGSLGEYIFPADLAFVIYRNGATMDLGNLSSVLRNNAPAFLEHLRNERNLGCGSGSLCSNRGGACPDCLMIPEVSCLTNNKLLSRSVLNGKGSPGDYGFMDDISLSGYFELAKSQLESEID